MPVDTVVLPEIEPATTTWELDVDRCALELNFALLGVTVWRARLRPVAARIVHGQDGPTELSVTVALRPSHTSLPGTSRFFLRSAARRGGWAAALGVRFAELSAHRAVVSAVGEIVPRPDTPIPALRTRFELAAEFVRCG